MDISESNSKSTTKILFIVGPTATGKSDLAIALAERLKAEIISADSMQVYRYMDIGTAKPSRKMRNLIPHHFIDILNPDELFSAGDFARLGRRLIDEKKNQNIPLIVVGGTGLYIKALDKGLVNLPAIPEGIKISLWETYMDRGLPFLYENLQKIDPTLAVNIHPNDRFRILRALGIYKTTGKPLSSFQQQHRFKGSSLQALKIGLTHPREILYNRIEKRVDWMIKNGWIEEVKTLLAQGYHETLKPMQAIGYRQLTEVIRGKRRLASAVEEIKKETRHLAKRQITWFKKEAPDLWINPDSKSLSSEVDSILMHLNFHS